MPAEMALGSVARLGIECADCGRSRWIAPSQITKRGVTLHTCLHEVASKLSCSACRADGLPGKNVSVQAFFDRDADRIRAEREVLRNQVALSRELRAKGA
ncbi:hypothetical protein FDR95_12030 [Rhizobiaceae bacterium LC148]|nr:hypothetical protein FDR95_12030 [Rhizobiaceae bacterium LC148]